MHNAEVSADDAYLDLLSHLPVYFGQHCSV